jgi:hypothetical protein
MMSSAAKAVTPPTVKTATAQTALIQAVFFNLVIATPSLTGDWSEDYAVSVNGPHWP